MRSDYKSARTESTRTETPELDERLTIPSQPPLFKGRLCGRIANPPEQKSIFFRPNRYNIFWHSFFSQPLPSSPCRKERLHLSPNPGLTPSPSPKERVAILRREA